jgi:hypothetical protein
MVRVLSAGLTAEMDSLDRHVSTSLTAERWLPKWTAKISGLTDGKTEQYAHGHAAAVAVDANGPGEDIVFRARSGSATTPQNTGLYIQIIKGAALETPENWTTWTYTGISGLMCPAWTVDNGNSYNGGSIAVAVWDNGGTWTGRVFYTTHAAGYLRCADFNLATGAAIGGEVTIATLGTGVQLYSMQIASCRPTEVFALLYTQVEASQAAWQKAIYGTTVQGYAYSGSWAPSSWPFPYHTLMDGGLVKDTSNYDSGGTLTAAQWGKRPCGGLAVSEVDANTVVVTFGAIHWRRRGYWTNNTGLRSFIYHRNSGWWEQGAEVDKCDFVSAQRIKLPMFARGCQVDGNNIIVWSRLVEPSNFQQTEAAPSLARVRDVVFARLSADGRYFTHFERLGEQDDFTAASLVKVNHAGGQKLYALGWRSVSESDMAAAVGDVDYPLNLGDYATSWNLTVNNRLGMTLGVNMHDAAPIYAGDLEYGMLVRANFGLPGEVVQVGQGRIDQISAALQSSGNQIAGSATINAVADKSLQGTVAEAIGDELAHNQFYVEPTNPIKHVAVSRGKWIVESMLWPENQFHGVYTSLNGKWAYRLKSFPYALATLINKNNPGSCLTSRPDYMGTWFKNIVWLGANPRVEGMIEASVRFGITRVEQENAVFDPVTVGDIPYRTEITVNKANGVYTSVNWRFYNNDNNELQLQSTPNQRACMAGVICHAPEVGRKFSFIWEYGTPLADYTHIEDTQRSTETFDNASVTHTGANILYLIESDFDSTGANWVHKEVAYCPATGLTPGKPADLRMQVLGGTIYCFYRPHATDAEIAAGTQPNWQFAFSFKSGRFGASQFGLVGRAMATIQWDTWMDLKRQYTVEKLVNEVDFWGIRVSDAVMDRTMEEHLTRRCWQGWTPTVFTPKVNNDARTVNSGASYNYAIEAINPTIDFNVNIPGATNEAGVFLRGIDPTTPTNTCIKIGLVAHSTTNAASTTVYYYAVKRRFSGGSEVVSAREYAPSPLIFYPGLPIPVRVTVRGNVYAVWVGGNFVGYFQDSTALGVYFGLYSTGGNASFTKVYVPELYETPMFEPVSVGQTMAAAVNQILNGRRIKAVVRWDGSVKFGYFFEHDTGLSFSDTILSSTQQTNDRFLSVVRVDGGSYTWAEYQSAALLAKGRHFQAVHKPDIFHWEFAYREALAIAQEAGERQINATFDILPDLRVEPEDQHEFIVPGQDVAGDYIIDDIRFDVAPAQEKAAMTFGVRGAVVL